MVCIIDGRIEYQERRIKSRVDEVHHHDTYCDADPRPMEELDIEVLHPCIDLSSTLNRQQRVCSHSVEDAEAWPVRRADSRAKG